MAITDDARAAHPTTVTDRSGIVLGGVDRAFHRFESMLDLIAAIAITGLMFVGVAQVVGRTVFDYPIDGYIDYIEQATAVFAFLGIAYCQATAGHIRMELLVGQLKGRSMWLLESFGVLLALVIVAILIDSSFQNFLRAYQLGDSTIDIGLPIWPSKLVVPFALTTLWLRLALQLWGYLRIARHPEFTPVAVPIAKTAAQIAKDEIASVLQAEGASS